MTALSMLYAVTLGPIAWVVTLPYTYPTLALPLYLAGALSIIAYLVIVVVRGKSVACLQSTARMLLRVAA